MIDGGVERYGGDSFDIEFDFMPEICTNVREMEVTSGLNRIRVELFAT